MNELTLSAFREKFTSRTVATSVGNWDVWGGEGGGDAIVFLPGAQGTGEVFFKPMLEFSDRFKVLTVTYPADPDAGKLADGLDALMTQLGLSDAVIVGSSFGGYLAQRFAEKYPSRVSRLVIGNSFSDATSVQSTRYNPDNLKGMDASVLKQTMLGRIKDGPDSELRSVLLDVMGEKQPAEFLKSRALGVALSTPMTAPPVDVSRILVVDSDPDPVIGEEMRDGLAALYAGASHTRIPGGGHYPYISNYAEYGAALSAFLGD